MWKKAFLVLLSLDLLLVVAAGVWFASLPQAGQSPPPSAPASSRPASIQLDVGQEAINSYLAYAISRQADVRKVVDNAQVQFATGWNLQFGIRLSGRIVPVTLAITPHVNDGNLDLQVDDATLGDLPVPTDLLFLVFRHLPWPTWIGVDTNRDSLNLNFTERPQSPYGVRVINYSSATRKLSLLLTLQPATAFSHTA